MPRSDTAWGERVEEAIETVLRPLLAADGGGIDVLDIDTNGREVHVRLTGKAAFSVGGQYVRTLVIEPLIRKAAGEVDVRVVVEESTTRPSSQEIEVSKVMREMALDTGAPQMAPTRAEARAAIAPDAPAKDSNAEDSNAEDSNAEDSNAEDDSGEADETREAGPRSTSGEAAEPMDDGAPQQAHPSAEAEEPDTDPNADAGA